MGMAAKSSSRGGPQPPPMDDLEFARLMEAAPDEGFIGETVITDSETGERIAVDTLAFNDGK